MNRLIFVPAVLLTTLLLLCSAVVRADTIYDAAVQFDTSNNPSSVDYWSYGYGYSLGGAFSLLTHASGVGVFEGWDLGNQYPDVWKNVSGSAWTGYGGFVPKDGLTLANGDGIYLGTYAAARWTTPASGIYSINATFTGEYPGSNTLCDVHILVDGVSVFDSTTDQQSSTSYSSSRLLNPGDTVDFVLGQASGNREVLDATISPVPEPSTLALLGVGVISLLTYAWRRRKVA